MSTEDKRIRELAHQIWESEGKPHGEDARHWEMARKLAEAEALTPSKTPKAAAKAKPKAKPAAAAAAKPAAAPKPGAAPAPKNPLRRRSPRPPEPKPLLRLRPHRRRLSRHRYLTGFTPERPRSARKIYLQEHLNEQTQQAQLDAGKRAVADS
ncbi:DUF2934 domain-containing protein [Pseudomonas sp. TH32]|nr:DUF2934 domain-containing protein [Pseudomonas sp. TH32]